MWEYWTPIDRLPSGCCLYVSDATSVIRTFLSQPQSGHWKGGRSPLSFCRRSGPCRSGLARTIRAWIAISSNKGLRMLLEEILDRHRIGLVSTQRILVKIRNQQG